MTEAIYPTSTFSRDRSTSSATINSLKQVKELIAQYCPNVAYKVVGKDVVFSYSIHSHYVVNAKSQKTEHLIESLKEVATLK